MQSYTIVELNNIIPRFEQFRFQDAINWTIQSDEHWAIIGPNGAGKSMLIDILLGRHALQYNCKIRSFDKNGHESNIKDTVKAVAFKDIYSIVDTKESYYQQRWNKGLQTDISKVKDIVSEAEQEKFEELVQWFKIEDLMNKEVNLLSSGELRKFLIVSSLLTNPRVLILDNPYIGLDSESRVILNDLLTTLAQYKKLQIVLIVSNPDEIPAFITHILPIKAKKLYTPLNRSDFLNNKQLIDELFAKEALNNSIQELKSHKETNNDFIYTFNLKNILIKYDDRVILKDLNWEVKKGEKWALLGPNGSGKSTLLSLINGDNPQAYANDITLFDRKRGSGESIWDIKNRIGYISPEMHLYYLKNVRCLDVVGSGFFDTIGLYRKCNSEQEDKARKWMKTLGVEHLENTSFLHISTGEQRLVLMARVLVKDPELLILDEPMHGLDIENKKRIKKIIEDYCDKDKTLIYVTHHPNEIPDIVNKQLILAKTV